MAQRVPDGGRGEALRHLQSLDGLDDVSRIDGGRPRKVHARQDRRHAHGSVEKPEQRKAGQVDFARLDAVEVADLGHLPIEVAVAIEDALGRAGAAGGEDDRGGIVGGDLWQIDSVVFRLQAQIVERVAAPPSGGRR